MQVLLVWNKKLVLIQVVNTIGNNTAAMIKHIEDETAAFDA